ncbi:MAG TPA: M24 family metallopeptidase, partial [bacterium]|nr:M24 family metallopeptidase [bacterium]
EMSVIPWADDRDKYISGALIAGKKALSDSPLAGADTLPGDFIDLMMSLTPSEIARYTALGADTGSAVEAATRAVRPGMTENEIAGRLARECYDRNIVPIVALIAADARLTSYRHPIPTENKVEKTAMVVVCGRRKGLIASATRIVSAGPVSDDLRRRHDVCALVDVAFNASTRPGVPIADVFNAGVKAYTDGGYKDEWLLHHQGGPTGYRSRYYTAHSATPGLVAPNSAFAWNPSVTGTKTEDTIITLENAVKFITHTGGWPYLKMGFGGVDYERPDILIL